MSSPDREGDLLENQPPAASAGQFKELEEKIFILRRLFLVVLLAFIFLGLSLNLYLHRQTREALRRFEDARSVITHYEQVQRPFIQNFAGSLQAFANTHPDFNAIFTRYLPQQQASNPTPAQAMPLLRTPPLQDQKTPLSPGSK